MANSAVNKKKGHLFPAAEIVNLHGPCIWNSGCTIFANSMCTAWAVGTDIPLTVGGNLSVGMLQVMGHNSFCMAMWRLCSLKQLGLGFV